jgi:hypothetical protein
MVRSWDHCHVALSTDCSITRQNPPHPCGWGVRCSQGHPALTTVQCTQGIKQRPRVQPPGLRPEGWNPPAWGPTRRWRREGGPGKAVTRSSVWRSLSHGLKTPVQSAQTKKAHSALETSRPWQMCSSSRCPLGHCCRYQKSIVPPQ